jgi:hypothetical protein
MSFDPDAFMNMPADPMKTNYENIREGEFLFMIEEVKFDEMKWNDKNTGEPRSVPLLRLTCVLMDGNGGAEEKARLGRDKLTVRADLTLDLDSNGKMDGGPNKNVKLGQLRAALGQNTPGWTPSQFQGAGPFVGKVTHRSDKNDPTKKYAEISRFAPVS